MSHAVSLERLWGPNTRGVLLSALAILALTGCGGGGGGGTGIDPNDDHGSSAFNATVITPDGANFKGQINYPTDVDWFRFRGIQAITYVLQIEGFPPDPRVRPDLDLTGDGTFNLTAQIIGIDGATQLYNTAGTEGGDVYDIDPAGTTTEENEFVTGDTRIVWTCPTTNDYFIKIAHSREQTGIGAYELHLATSQIATVFSVNTAGQTGANDLFIADDQGVWFDGWMGGYLEFDSFEIEEELGRRSITGVASTSEAVFQPGGMDPDPEDIALHLHYGFGNIYSPSGSSEPNDNTHSGFLEASFPCCAGSARDGVSVTDARLTLPDGSVARVPVEYQPVQLSPDLPQHAYRFSINLGDAVTGSRLEPIPDNVMRSLVGRRWYADVHPITDMELDSNPAAVSLPEGDVYQMFQSELQVDTSSVILRDGFLLPENPDRGLAGFQLLYDASLKLFQVAHSTYFVDVTCTCEVPPPTPENPNPVQPPPTITVFSPDYAGFVGQRVRVHQGGPGQTGPVIIDVGTLPPAQLPPIISAAGFKVPIRQLTDAEQQILRNAYYTTGFYVQVTDSVTGAPLLRADSTFMEISVFPTLEPCSFPPCSGRDASPGVLDRGTVNFATTRAGTGDITVYLNGEIVGRLNQAISPDNVPACGLTGDGRTVATEIYPENYYWHAYAEDGTTWDGHVTVGTDTCETILLE